MPLLPDGVISSQLPDRDVVDLEVPFSHKFFKVAEAERKPKIPARR
jgi:hypothetical protein